MTSLIDKAEARRSKEDRKRLADFAEGPPVQNWPGSASVQAKKHHHSSKKCEAWPVRGPLSVAHHSLAELFCSGVLAAAALSLS